MNWIKQNFYKDKSFWIAIGVLIYFVFAIIAFQIVGFRETTTDSKFTVIYNLKRLLTAKSERFDLTCFALIIVGWSFLLIALCWAIFNFFFFGKKLELVKAKKISQGYLLFLIILIFIITIMPIVLHLITSIETEKSSPNPEHSIIYSRESYIGQFLLIIFGFLFSITPYFIKKLV